MIKTFKEYIEESVFDDIISRSKGNETRREDDINRLDRDGMYDYILNHFAWLKLEPQFLKSGAPTIYEHFSLPVFKDNIYGVYRLIATYTNGKISDILLHNADPDDCKNFKEELYSKFKVHPEPKGMVIQAKDGTLSNKTLLGIIDTITDNAINPIIKRLKHD